PFKFLTKMKKIRVLFWFYALYAAAVPVRGQVGVNILTTHTSVALQVNSPPGAFRGFLTPTMSPYNRVSIPSGTNTAADGLMVYDTYHRMPYYFNASINKWVSMSRSL